MQESIKDLGKIVCIKGRSELAMKECKKASMKLSKKVEEKQLGYRQESMPGTTQMYAQKQHKSIQDSMQEKQQGTALESMQQKYRGTRQESMQEKQQGNSLGCM